MARRVPPDLVAAARVHAARERVLHAVGELAAEPLDVCAAGQMRAALDAADSPDVRAALRQLRAAPLRSLRVVRDGEAPGPPAVVSSLRSAVPVVGGAA